jgi:hypothetical protein
MRAVEALWKLLFVFGKTACAQWTSTTAYYLDATSRQFVLDCNPGTSSYQDPGHHTWASPVWGPKSPGLWRFQSLQSAPKVPLHLESAEEVPVGLTPGGHGLRTTVSERTVYLGTFLETPSGEHLLKSHRSYQSQPTASELGHFRYREQPPGFDYLQCTIARRSKDGRACFTASPPQNHDSMFSIDTQYLLGTIQQR